MAEGQLTYKIAVYAIRAAKMNLSKRVARAQAGEEIVLAQAILDDLALVSNEHTFDLYGVTRLW